ncbi:hypothetical protein S40293_05072 [Stachybotrys chartarum IBT 40293]|nr:hypothetical protein S40293_05072 [Stachybotrys chartarum IBT 40293]
MSSSCGSSSSLAGGASLTIGPDQYEPTQEYQEALRAMAMDGRLLLQYGYILRQLSRIELERKKRCFKCTRVLKARDVVVEAGQAKKVPEVQAKCSFHSGRVAYGKWTCCNGHPRSKPCNHQLEHTARYYAPDELADTWRFYDTPERLPTERPAALAVSIDCEMGTAVSGDSEVIRVSVVDYYNGRVLLDKLVYPDVPMAHYNTSWSGVSFRDMSGARRARTCIFGRDNARRAVWELIGRETIVVGHACQNDLNALRMLHPLVVDTQIYENQKRAEATRAYEMALERDGLLGEEHFEAPDEKYGMGLKDLAVKYLHRVIQTKGRGHDSVEDAMATRDILHVFVTEEIEQKKMDDEISEELLAKWQNLRITAEAA